MGAKETPPLVPTPSLAREDLRKGGSGWTSALSPPSQASLWLRAWERGRKREEKKRRGNRGEAESRKECILSVAWRGGEGMGGALTPRPRTGRCPAQGFSGEAVEAASHPPTHYSALGGPGSAKLSTKIRLRCRSLPIALNRADWIRIFLFSSYLDCLGDWGPPKGSLGSEGRRGRSKAS